MCVSQLKRLQTGVQDGGGRDLHVPPESASSGKQDVNLARTPLVIRMFSGGQGCREGHGKDSQPGRECSGKLNVSKALLFLACIDSSRHQHQRARVRFFSPSHAARQRANESQGWLLPAIVQKSGCAVAAAALV